MQWREHKGAGGPGSGKKIVLVSGDEEYRSEESLPMLGEILAAHHGFDCAVLFAVDPETGEIDPTVLTNIPGLEQLDAADCMIIATRFRELPDDQMKHIVEFVEAGKPVIGMRTATHAFRYKTRTDSPYAKYDCTNKEFEGGFGRQILGETWVAHHGVHGKEGTRGVVNSECASDPILRGVADVFGTTDVYAVTEITGSPRVLLHGQVLTGLDHDDAPKPDTPMMPLAWTKEYTGERGNTSKVFCTTMGAATDFTCADLRRLIVNAAYWCVGLEDAIRADGCVDTVSPYEPTPFGFGTHRKGMKP
jgi:type 1 glutamine amidotransferase